MGKYINATEVFNRLMELKSLSNLEEVAEFLGMKYGTIRNRKSRESIPYEEIVAKLCADELAFVLKGYKPSEDPVVADPLTEYQVEQLKSFEKQAMRLVERIETGPWSTEAKISLIDSLLRIVDKELNELQDHAAVERPADPGAER